MTRIKSLTSREFFYITGGGRQMIDLYLYVSMNFGHFIQYNAFILSDQFSIRT